MSRTSMMACCLCLACALSACGPSDEERLAALPALTRAHILAAKEQPDCVRVVGAYVLRTRSWNATTYFVAVSHSVAAGRGFAVLHVDELADPLYLGERKSFHVELDPSCSKVTEELQFQ